METLAPSRAFCESPKRPGEAAFILERIDKRAGWQLTGEVKY